MDFRKYYGQLDTAIHNYFRKKISKSFSEETKRGVTKHYGWKPLSKEQKNEIAMFWGLKNPKESDFYIHQAMLNVKGEFDVRYCPQIIFRRYLDPLLGDRKLTFAWDDKNYFDRHQPSLPLPYTLVRNINGYYLDHDYKPITIDEAHKIIASNLPVIIKPSLVSGHGRGVELVSDVHEIGEINSKFEMNYCIQKQVVQCDELSMMSPRCVNVMRVVTAIIDGEPKLITSCLRCNTSDAIADNVTLGEDQGMVVIGINDNGTLYDKGYYEDSKEIQKLPSGYVFGGLQIPSYEEAVNLAIEAHKSMPMFTFIGWDITIDENNRPLFFEWNLGGIGIYMYQIAAGPLFGKHTEYFAEMSKKIVNEGK